MLWNIISLSLYNQGKQGNEGWSTEAKAKGQKKKSLVSKKQGPVPSETTKVLNFATELNDVTDRWTGTSAGAQSSSQSSE